MPQVLTDEEKLGVSPQEMEYITTTKTVHFEKIGHPPRIYNSAPSRSCQNNYVNIIFFNAQSIMNKTCDLENEVLDSDTFYSIIAITETWASDQFPENIFRNEFDIFRKDREGRGGGVMILVRKVLNAQVCSDLDAFVGEVLLIDIEVDGSKVRIAVIYRPPPRQDRLVGEKSDFAYMLNTSADRIHYDKAYMQLLLWNILAAINTTIPVVLVGDFNFPRIDWNGLSAPTGLSELFLNFCVRNGLSQLVKKPTHRSGNILDLLLVNEPNLVCDVEVQDNFSTSDHYKICATIKVNPKVEIQPIPKRNFWNGDYDSFAVFLDSVDWPLVFMHCASVNDFWQAFLCVVYTGIDCYIQFAKTNGRNSQKNKLTATVVKAKREKQIRCRIVKRNGTPANVLRAREATRNARNAIRKHHEKQESDVLKSGDPKKFFGYVNSRLTCRPSIAILKDESGESVADPVEKASLLNEYFGSVFITDNGNLPALEPRVLNKSFQNVVFNEEDILLVLQKLPEKSSVGPDGISTILLQRLRRQLVRPLATIFEVSLRFQKLPDQWKEANVSAIFKGKGSASSARNYRPVSLTSNVCKVMERIIKNQLMSYLLENSLITEHQHGFLAKRSTLTQLLECSSDWIEWLDNKIPVDCAYLDFAKAFDTVSHPKLVYKLAKYGISSDILEWFKDFLTGRSQKVVVSGHPSTTERVTSGVPQGSVLGPVMFLLYVNDVIDVIKSARVKVYADDIKLYFRASDDNDKTTLANDLQAIGSWANVWQLELSVPKCLLLHIGNNNHGFDHDLGGSALTVVPTVQDLGMTMSSSFEFSRYISDSVRRATLRSNLIFRSFTLRKQQFLMKMYYAFVRPLVEYNTTIWSPHLIYQINAIETVQRSYTSRIPSLYPLSYPYRNDGYTLRLASLGIDSLEERRIRTDLVVLHDLVHKNIICNVQDGLVVQTRTGRGHSLKLFLPRANLNVKRCSFPVRSIQLWNSLPENLVIIKDSKRFRKHLRSVSFQHLLKGVGKPL